MKHLLVATVLGVTAAWLGSIERIRSQEAEAATPGSTASKGAELADLVRTYETDQGAIRRFYDLPWSAERHSRLDELDATWQRRLSAVKFERLGVQGRIDYVLLRNALDSERERVALERRQLEEMHELLRFRDRIQRLERTRWQMKPVDVQASATEVAGVVDQVKQARERVKKETRAGEKPKGQESPKEPARGADEAKSSGGVDEGGRSKGKRAVAVTPAMARRLAGATEALRGTLKTWYSYYDGSLPEFGWWLKKPYEEANRALEEYAKFLREEIAGLKGKEEDPLIGEPVGRDRLASLLATEMIAYTPEELITIGEAEFAWCEVEMKKAAADMGFGDDWKAALAKVKSAFVPPGQQDSLMAQCGRDAIAFVQEHHLVTVPPLAEELWRVTMLSADAQKTIPYAAYGGQSMLVAYAKEDMKQEDKMMAMRGNNRHFTRIVTAHELIPGHHLQAFMMARHRPYRSAFATPFAIEGWALYWELRLWELGYGRTPEERIGMLFWRMHRSARIIVSLRFHLGEMTPQQMIDFLVERVGHEKLGATSEVRRFIGDAYSPLYQCAYMIGGLQLRALRREIVPTGGMSERQFHDAVLTCGPIAIELIRAALLNQPPGREARAHWKFVGEDLRPER